MLAPGDSDQTWHKHLMLRQMFCLKDPAYVSNGLYMCMCDKGGQPALEW